MVLLCMQYYLSATEQISMRDATRADRSRVTCIIQWTTHLLNSKLFELIGIFFFYCNILFLMESDPRSGTLGSRIRLISRNDSQDKFSSTFNFSAVHYGTKKFVTDFYF